MFCLQLRADLDVVGVVDLLVDVGDLLGGHVVRGDDLTEETHADLPLDVAEAHVVLGPDANLQTRGSDPTICKIPSLYPSSRQHFDIPYLQLGSTERHRKSQEPN